MEELKVPIRKFTREIYEYIKREGTYNLTIRDSIQLVVTIKKYNSVEDTNVMTNSVVPEKIKEPKAKLSGVEKHGVIQKLEKFKEEKEKLTYGCGCKKGKSILCPAHHRL